MLPATVNAPAAEPPAALLADYATHLARSGRGNVGYERAARSFLRRWPQVQAWAALPLGRRLAAGAATRPFVTFLMVSRRLRPGYDYLLARKLSSFWRDLAGSVLQPDLDRFIAAATELGFSERVASGVASQVIARLLIETGRGLDELTEVDLAALAQACRERQRRTGRGVAALPHRFAHGPAGALPPPLPLEVRMADVGEPLRAAFVAYLTRKSATCRPKTVSSLATRLAHFGRFLAAADPELSSLAALERRRHIEPFITSLTTATNTVTGEPITVADRAGGCTRSRTSSPRSPSGGGRTHRPLADFPLGPATTAPTAAALPARRRRRRLSDTLAASANRLAADALLLQRACGLRNR